MTSALKNFKPEELLGHLNDVEAKFAPQKLFVAGDPKLLRVSPRVAVIGTRHPSDQGISRANRLAKTLVKHGAIIVSGLAEGIDTVAHKSAIDNGGRTIAVLGTSLCEVFPKKNRRLQEEIMRKHLAVTQFPCGWPIQRKNFPMRNRTMALIADVSIIVEAGNGSGTLSQGWETLRLGKPLYILRAVCENRSLSWPREMINYGAMPLSEPAPLLESLPPQASDFDRYVTL